MCCAYAASVADKPKGRNKRSRDEAAKAATGAALEDTSVKGQTVGCKLHLKAFDIVL